MRAALHFVIALVLVTPAFAQDPASVSQTNSDAEPAQPKPPVPVPALPQGRITGSVLCADTRQPARGATVMLQAIPSGKDEKNRTGRLLTTHVTAAGTYTVEHVPPGRYVVLGLFPGYLSPYDDLPDTARTNDEAEMVKLLAAQGTTTVSAGGTAVVNIILPRGAAISGRVLYSDGSPATQATLSLEDLSKTAKPRSDQTDVDFSTVVRTMVLHQTIGTDDLGRFRLSGIKPGKYRLAAVPPASNEDNSGAGEMQFVIGMFSDPKAMRIYAGDTIHKNAAKKYDLRPGDEITGVDIRIPVDGFHSVRGLVNAVDGRPVNMGSLTLTDSSDDSVIFYTSLATDGTFHFASVPTGTYTLEAKDAKIGAVPAELAAQNVEVQGGMLTPTNAFADGTTPILVKDSDLNGVVLSLTEVPMPKAPANPTPDPND